MERFLGAFEHAFWLYDQVRPVHFALCATISGRFSIEQLRHALTQVQHQHPLLNVRIAVEPNGQPKFVEQPAEIPLRVMARFDDQQWQQKVATELSRSFDWQTAPLARVVLLHSETRSELIVTCHHAIADGLSVAYLIRDIVKYLTQDSAVKHDLSDSLTVESVLPKAFVLDQPLPTPSAMAPAYDTAVSTRPEPHLRATLLSAELTQQLRDRSRTENTSVHGAISAAFLLTLAQQTPGPLSALQCLSPINVRSYLPPAVQEAMGLYINYGRTNHDLSGDEALWDVARSLKAQLAVAMAPPQVLTGFAERQAVIATCPTAQLVAAGMVQQYGYNLLATNLGQLDLPQQFGELRLEALYGPAVMAGMAQERIVGVATLGDRLSLTVSYPGDDLTAGPANVAATNLLSRALQLLHQAVQPASSRPPTAQPDYTKTLAGA